VRGACSAREASLSFGLARCQLGTIANSPRRLAEVPAADHGDTVQTFGAPPEVDGPFDIKDGPGGWLWFTNKSGNSPGRIYVGNSAAQDRSASASSSQS
jgi:hypothetical protein